MLNPAVHVRRREVSQGQVVYAMLPPHAPERFESITPRGAIGISFSGHHRAVRRYENGPTEEGDIAPGDAFLVSAGELRWLDVQESGEALEIYPDPAQLRRVSHELGASRDAELPDVDGAQDPVIWAAAASLRARLRTGVHENTMALAETLEHLFVHVLPRYSGLGNKERPSGSLDTRRLARVLEFIDACLHLPIRLEDLARVAALSPYHFSRAFRATLGLPPHRFITARRMERAGRLVSDGFDADAAALAVQVGYASVSHFRESFAAAFGVTPAQLRAELASVRRCFGGSRG